jgi:ubiquinone/menaquinone biosynthesis C-methylase UbiE
MASHTQDTGSFAPLSPRSLYDNVGPVFEAAFVDIPGQAESLKWLIKQLEQHKPAKVVDLGCGTGRPVCSELVAAGHDVLGIDISSNMLDAARKNVPQARFELKDIRYLETLQESPCDAITLYFSLIVSISQDHIRDFIRRIYGWLKPGGYFVFGTVPIPGNNVEIQWMGQPCVISSLSAEETIDWIREVGFKVVHHTESKFMPNAKPAVEAGLCKEEDLWEEPFLFVYARKP